jgi:hypothetical protein
VRAVESWRVEPRAHFGASTGVKITTSKNTALARGVAYHRRVYRALSDYCVLQPELGRLHIEPWIRSSSYKLRSPDAVLIDEVTGTGLIIEVKMNWSDGRDVKLIDEYLPGCQSAYGLSCVWPLLITQNLRGYRHKPLLGLGQLSAALAWQPGDPTPLLLLP